MPSADWRRITATSNVGVLRVEEKKKQNEKLRENNKTQQHGQNGCTVGHHRPSVKRIAAKREEERLQAVWQTQAWQHLLHPRPGGREGPRGEEQGARGITGERPAGSRAGARDGEPTGGAGSGGERPGGRGDDDDDGRRAPSPLHLFHELRHVPELPDAAAGRQEGRPRGAPGADGVPAERRTPTAGHQGPLQQRQVPAEQAQQGGQGGGAAQPAAHAVAFQQRGDHQGGHDPHPETAGARPRQLLGQRGPSAGVARPQLGGGFRRSRLAQCRHPAGAR